MNCRFLPEAHDELNNAILFYEARQEGLGVRFRRAVEAAVQRIRDGADTFAFFEEPYRYCPVPSFPYLLIYAVDNDVLIVAVMHQRRRPNYWKDRFSGSED